MLAMQVNNNAPTYTDSSTGVSVKPVASSRVVSTTPDASQMNGADNAAANAAADAVANTVTASATPAGALYRAGITSTRLQSVSFSY